MTQEEPEQSIAHHGPPIFTDRDLHTCIAMRLWIETARKGNPKHYGENWLPSEVDMIKSRLFWRLRSGKQPLPEAPPRAYSCPWYEVVEEDRPHFCREMFVVENIAHIAQCAYQIEKMEGDEPSIIKYNCYSFKVWRGNSSTVREFEGQVGVWLQRILKY
jgi:hypothetical protein